MDTLSPSDCLEINDGVLLREFLQTHADQPFAELVRRHSGMVLSVCWRTIRHKQDAEDAMQAVFLTLARKAKSLAGRESVAGWLYYVARNISLRLNESKALRETREKEAGIMNPSISQNEEELRREELRLILDEELDALPEKHRVPMILYHFEDKTIGQIAGLLGVNDKTLQSRLESTRLKLQKRLVRRGVTLSAAAIGTLLTGNASVSASPELVITTVKTAMSIVTPHAVAAGAISPQVMALTQGMIKAMFIQKIKIASVVSVAVMTTLTGGMMVQKVMASLEPKTAVVNAPPQKSAPELLLTSNSSTAQTPAQNTLKSTVKPPVSSIATGTMQRVITKIYWLEDEKERPDCVSNALKWDEEQKNEKPPFINRHDGFAHLFVHMEDGTDGLPAKERDYYRHQFNMEADMTFFFKAEGYPDIVAKCPGLSIKNEWAIIISKSEFAKMVSGVSYKLVPRNSNPGFQWVVKEGGTILVPND